MSSRRFCKAASKDSCSSFRCWQYGKNGSKKKITDGKNDETDGGGTTHIQPKYLLCICLHLVYIWHLLYVCVRLLVSFPTGNWSWWTKDFFSELLTVYNVYSLYPQCKDHPPSCIAKELHGWRHAPRLSLPESNAGQHVHVRNSGSWFCRSTSQIRAFLGGIPFLNHPKPPFGVRSCDVLSYHLHLLFCRCCGNHTTRSPTTAVAADLDCIHHDFHYR